MKDGDVQHSDQVSAAIWIGQQERGKILRSNILAFLLCPIERRYMGFRQPWSVLTEESCYGCLSVLQAPILKEVYAQREVLTNLFEKYQSKAQAEQAFTQWLNRITDLGLKCFSSL